MASLTSLLVLLLAAQGQPAQLVIDAEWPPRDTLRLELSSRLTDLAEVVEVTSGDGPRYNLRLSPGAAAPDSISARSLAVLLTDADGHELLRGEARVPSEELAAARYVAVLVEGALRMFALTGAPPRFEPVRPQPTVVAAAPPAAPGPDVRLSLAVGPGFAPAATLRAAVAVRVSLSERLGLGLRLAADVVAARSEGLATREGFGGVEAVLTQPLGPLIGVAGVGLGATLVRASIEEPRRAHVTSLHASASARAGLDWPLDETWAVVTALELLALAEPPEHLVAGRVLREAAPVRVGASIGLEVRP